MSKKPVLLCIMDGFGWVPNETYGNAVVAAKTPHLDAMMAKYPMTTIEASGMAVGLPDGQMGNSEVGHTNMGAGRIVYQQLTLITKSIRDGEMFKNPVLVKNMKAAIEASYAADKTDEFVLPCVTCEGGRVQDGDTVIFMNFRPDRARQMTRIFCDDDFKGFERRGGRKQVNYVCMAEYDATMPTCEVAYPPVELKNVLGQYRSENGKTQLRIAETEKYAHVTFFFNGGVEAPYEGEDRCVIPSPKVATYDLQPQMSAPEVAAECVKRIESGKYDVVILNFANCDMVGHTGVFDAAVKAVETVDECVGQVVEATLKMGGIAMITADHGNAEQMLQADGKSPMTAHTTNVVPFILCGAGTELREGRLADIAPTILDVMGLEQPAEMDGKTLIVR